MADCNYWKEFYNKNKTLTQKCSPFCSFVIDYFKDNVDIHEVLDAGCGNGRDTYVLSNVYNTTGIDNCGVIPNDISNAHFDISDFVIANKTGYDLIYSRFTLHSITNEQQHTFINSIEKGSYLAIEARSIKGKDDECVFGKDHYRNYIDCDKLRQQLVECGFEILYIAEGNNMALYKTEDPICVRVICRKK